MSKPQRTPEGKWAIYHAVTGQRIDRWPVDARGMLATGEYTATPPAGTPGLPPVSPTERGIIERPDAVIPIDKRGTGPQQLVHHRVLEPDNQGPAPTAEPPRNVGDEFPAGYAATQQGRFVELRGPDGEMVRSATPSGKHDGMGAARVAAWAHADGA